MCQQNQLIPSRIESVTFFQENWEGSNEKRVIPKLHVRLALVDSNVVKLRRKMIVSVESTEKFDSSTIAFDCSDEEFRSIEAPLYQVLHRTTANEPLRIVQQTRRTEGI